MKPTVRPLGSRLPRVLHQLIYTRATDPEPIYDIGQHLPHYETWRVPTEDGSEMLINYLPSTTLQTPSKNVFIYFLGAGRYIQWAVMFLALLQKLLPAVDFVLPEWRGHCTELVCRERPSEITMARDSDAMYKSLFNLGLLTPESRVVAYGVSLGGALATLFCHRRFFSDRFLLSNEVDLETAQLPNVIRGLIIDNSFRSMAHVFADKAGLEVSKWTREHRFFPNLSQAFVSSFLFPGCRFLTWFSRDQYNTEQRLVEMQQLDAFPVFMTAALRDDLIPPEQMKTLQLKVESELHCFDCRHGCCMDMGAEFLNKLLPYLKQRFELEGY